MFYPIVFSSVLLNIIFLTKSDEDVLVIDPRDLRLFESVWKLGYHPGVDMALTRHNSPSSKLPKPKTNNMRLRQLPMKLGVTPYSTTKSSEVFTHVGEEDFRFYKSPHSPDSKFMKKMFAPRFLNRFMNVDTTTEAYNDYGTNQSNFGPKTNDPYDITTKRTFSKKLKKMYIKKKLQDAIKRLGEQ